MTSTLRRAAERSDSAAERQCAKVSERSSARTSTLVHFKRVSALKISFKICMNNALARIYGVLLMYAVVTLFAAIRVVLMSDWWSIRMSLYASQIKAFKSAEPKTLGVSFTTAHYHIIMSIICSWIFSYRCFYHYAWFYSLSTLFTCCWFAAYEFLVIQSALSYRR